MGKNLEYLRYIVRHKAYVFLECCRLGIPWRGVVHDLSKFHPAEWLPYREYFYPETVHDECVGSFSRRVRERAFDAAWLRHIHCNPHHWQHWLLVEDDTGRGRALPMPENYVREMLADWRAMSRARGRDSVKDWYSEARKKMMLHETTEDLLHYLMTRDELSSEV